MVQLGGFEAQAEDEGLCAGGGIVGTCIVQGHVGVGHAVVVVKGFGFVQSKPASALSPVFVTPDALGDRWKDGKLSGALSVQLNGKDFGQADAGVDMTFDFGVLIAHLAKTRALIAGSIIGSGWLFGAWRAAGLIGPARDRADLPALPPGPAVILSGSCSAMTRRQVAAYAALAPALKLDPLRLDRGDDGGMAEWLSAQLHAGRVPIIHGAAEPAEARPPPRPLTRARPAGAGAAERCGPAPRRSTPTGCRRSGRRRAAADGRAQADGVALLVLSETAGRCRQRDDLEFR